MKKQLLDNALNKPIILILKIKSYKAYKGYLVKDDAPKRYKLLPLNIEEDIIVFPASYVKKYTFLYNNITITGEK